MPKGTKETKKLEVEVVKPKKKRKSGKKENNNFNKLLGCKDLEDCPINLTNHIIEEDSNISDTSNTINEEKKYFYLTLIEIRLRPFIKKSIGDDSNFPVVIC
jgi:hypothetical protein